MRLTEWPRMPFLNDEVKEWIAIELQSLGVEDLAVYALEAGTEVVGTSGYDVREDVLLVTTSPDADKLAKGA